MSSREDFRPGAWRRAVAIARLAALVICTIPIALSLSLLRLVTRGDLRRRVRSAWFSAWSRIVLRILGGRTEVHGTPPRGPFFLASNHLGYLDILVLAQVVPAVFVSKAEVRHWPVIGWLTRLADTLYINRERKSDIPRANAAIAAVIARGDGVTLFPEGSSSGSDFVLPVRPPLLEVAAGNGIPVSVAALYFETRPGDPHAHRSICYYGDMVFADHVWKLLHLRGFTVTMRFGAAPVFARERKLLARRVRAAIHELQLENPPATQSPGAAIAAVNQGLAE